MPHILMPPPPPPPMPSTSIDGAEAGVTTNSSLAAPGDANATLAQFFDHTTSSVMASETPSGGSGEQLIDQVFLDDLIVDGSIIDNAPKGDDAATTTTTVRGVQDLKTNALNEPPEAEMAVLDDSAGAEVMEGFLFHPATEEYEVDFASGLAPLENSDASDLALNIETGGADVIIGSKSSNDAFATATMDGVF